MRKVSRALRGSRRQRISCGGLTPVANALIRAEHEHPVAPDWTTRGRAELVLDQLRLGGLKEAPCVQVVIPVEFPRRTVDLVRPLPAHDGDVRPGISPAVRREVA